MASPNESEFRDDRRRPSVDGPGPHPAGHEQSIGPSLVAYIFIVPKEAEVSWAALRELISPGSSHGPISLPVAEKSNSPAADSWLSHSDAAEYLGLSESTLYRYAGRGQIECRKLCARLQYRLSSLDKFKEQHVRPARRPLRDRVIISTTPSSGK